MSVRVNKQRVKDRFSGVLNSRRDYCESALFLSPAFFFFHFSLRNGNWKCLENITHLKINWRDFVVKDFKRGNERGRVRGRVYETTK